MRVIPGPDETYLVNIAGENINPATEDGNLANLDTTLSAVAQDSTLTDGTQLSKVVGPTAAGAAPTTSPVLIAGSDGSLIRTLKVGTDGSLVSTATLLSEGTPGIALPSQAIMIAGQDDSGLLQVPHIEELALDKHMVTMSTDRDMYDSTGGRIFSVTRQGTYSPGATNYLIYLLNPIGSGKKVYIRNMTFSINTTATQRANFYVYLNPVVTANGTALTFVNQLSNGGTPTAQAFFGPTVSTVGSFLTHVVSYSTGVSPPLDFNYRICLAPGGSILITANPGGNNYSLIATTVIMER